MNTYKLTKVAVQEITDIALYTEMQWGVKQRNDYLDGLEQQFEQLAHAPLAPMVKPIFALKRNCYSFAYKKHLIIFKKNSTGIRIVRVLHQQMHIQRHL